jgi:hypothetical protein
VLLLQLLGWLQRQELLQHMVARVLLLLAQLVGVLQLLLRQMVLRLRLLLQMQRLHPPLIKMRDGLWLLLAVAGAVACLLQFQLLLTQQGPNRMQLQLQVLLVAHMQAAMEQQVHQWVLERQQQQQQQRQLHLVPLQRKGPRPMVQQQQLAARLLQQQQQQWRAQLLWQEQQQQQG